MPCQISNELAAGPNQIKQGSQRQGSEERNPIAPGALHVLKLPQQENKGQQRTEQSQDGTPQRWNAGDSNRGKRTAPNLSRQQRSAQTEIQPVRVNDHLRRKGKDFASLRESGMHASFVV